MTAKSPKVLGIIVTWNKKKFLDDLLRALNSLKRPPDEILLVDNASTDGSVEMVREKYPRTHLLLHSTNLGGSGGFNAGMRWGLERGGYDYFWLLDNDIVVHEGALQALLDVAEADERVGQVGSRIGELENPGRTQEVGARIDWSTGQLLKLGADEIKGMPGDPDYNPKPVVYDVDYVAACSCLARVKAIEEVGIWDEGLFVFWDDIEWGIRFNRAGWKVKATSASFVEHAGFWERRHAQNFEGMYYCLRNGIRTTHRHAPPLRRPLLLFKHFRALANVNFQYRRDGREAIARCNEVSVEDFFRSTTGKFPHKLAKETMPRTPGVSDEQALKAVPRRRGKLLFWTTSTSNETLAAYRAVQKKFSEHQVDLFIPPEFPEVLIPDLPNVVQRKTKTKLDRIRLMSWAKGNYDGVVRNYRSGLMLLDYTFPVSIWHSVDGSEITVTLHHPLLDPLIIAGYRVFSNFIAAGMTLRAMLKPRDGGTYYSWEGAGKAASPRGGK